MDLRALSAQTARLPKEYSAVFCSLMKDMSKTGYRDMDFVYGKFVIVSVY